MIEQSIIDTQLQFYKSGAAGCLFAAHAARNPEKYDWRLSVSAVESAKIETIVREAIAYPHVSTQSILFPSVVNEDDLKQLLAVLKETPLFFVEQEIEFRGLMCVGYRVRVEGLTSWVTGFGSFEFLPKTRQAIFTEIVFRSKPRPDYKTVMKESPEGVIHLADMDMKGMNESKFKSLWYGSLDNTEKVLGRNPDIRSAAKTTFSVPVSFWKRH